MHVVVRSIGRIEIYDNSIMPTAVKVLSAPLRIITKYEKFRFSIGMLYKL